VGIQGEPLGTRVVAPEANAGQLGTPAEKLWDTISSSADPSDYEMFLTKFPQGELSKMAEARIGSCITLCTDRAILKRLNQHGAPKLAGLDKRHKVSDAGCE